MNTYSIKIFSETPLQFFAGKAYLVQSKIEFDQKEMFNSKDAIYLNYPFHEAKKVVPFFESLRANEQNRIVKSIQDSFGFKVRVDDFFGKLLVTLFYNIELHNLVIVGLIGLSNSSIDTLIELLKRAAYKEKYKVVIMTKTSSCLNERISVTTFSFSATSSP